MLFFLAEVCAWFHVFYRLECDIVSLSPLFFFMYFIDMNAISLGLSPLFSSDLFYKFRRGHTRFLIALIFNKSVFTCEYVVNLPQCHIRL